MRCSRPRQACAALHGGRPVRTGDMQRPAPRPVKYGETMQAKRRPPAGRGPLIAGTILLALGPVVVTVALVSLLGSYTTVTARQAMEPTYRDGARVVVERIGGAAVRRGDVVLFTMPDRYGGLAVMQRVIGLGGDHIASTGGSLTVNGRAVEEPYVKPADIGPPTPDFDVTVPPGRMFLMGDNRQNSNDSRYFLTEHSGTVPTTAVQGRTPASATAPVALGLTAVLGVLCTVGGGICLVVGRRMRAKLRSPARGFAAYT
ncbi:signal peptidase I [Streptomyces sp. NPDC058155]|uniref:signal peptidase I n=1 Tax=Streptomyces sp. NPDC058155 TaxID=3346359 RepID=UPI0036EFAFBB